MHPANWNKDEMGPSTLLGLSSHTPHHMEFSYLGNSSGMSGDTHTQRLQEYNLHSPQGQVRNPDSSSPSTEKIVVAHERDVYGRSVVTHSYAERGQLFHRKYTFSDAELNQFIQQHPRIPVHSDGEQQMKHCDSNHYVEVEQSPGMSSHVFEAPTLMKSTSNTIPVPYDTPSSAGLFSAGGPGGPGGPVGPVGQVDHTRPVGPVGHTRPVGPVGHTDPMGPDFSAQMYVHDQSRNQHNTLPRSGC